MSRKQTLCRLTSHKAGYIHTNLLLQILMNAERAGGVVEARQCVTIHWDHSSAFAQKVLASSTKKKNVMVSVIQYSPYKTKP